MLASITSYLDISYFKSFKPQIFNSDPQETFQSFTMPDVVDNLNDPARGDFNNQEQVVSGSVTAPISP